MDYVGIGLRHCHFDDFIEQKPKIGWLEVHSENFFAKGGRSKSKLYEIQKRYPLSLHGVGLSLGSSDGVDKKHLTLLKNVVEEYNPFLLSEHLSWSRTGKHKKQFYPDLLPVPYNEKSLSIIGNNIKKVQDYLGRKILIENPSSYVSYNVTTMSEVDFLNQLVVDTECGILLDINNVYVSSFNLDLDADKYISEINYDAVGEVHLAGPSDFIINKKKILIDTHNSKVRDEVWSLYKKFISKKGKIYSLLEWDVDIPDLNVLLEEGYKIHDYLL